MSWHAVCHPDADGNFATTVDAARLPPLDPDAVDVDGNPVPLALQQQERAYRVARIEALARDRVETTNAFDAAFPESSIPLKDLANPEPSQSCQPAGTGPLPHELAAVLGRIVPLEDDGTVPLFTEALARVMNDVKGATDTQDALARFDARQGYRPLDIAMGVAQPGARVPAARAHGAVAPLARGDGLRSVQPRRSDRSVEAASASAIAGPSRGRLLRRCSSSSPSAARSSARQRRLRPCPSCRRRPTPPTPTRQLLSRPRSTLELTRQILVQSSAAFDVGFQPTLYVVQRDPRAYAAVPLVHGVVPPPFVDQDLGRAARRRCARAVRHEWRPAGRLALLFPGGVDGLRDSQGRAVGQASPTLYSTIDVGQTFMASLEQNLRPHLAPDPTRGDEAVMNVLGGSYVLFGNRDSGALTTRTYAPDPTSSNPTAPVTIAYSAFHRRRRPSRTSSTRSA